MSGITQNGQCLSTAQWCPVLIRTIPGSPNRSAIDQSCPPWTTRPKWRPDLLHSGPASDKNTNGHHDAPTLGDAVYYGVAGDLVRAVEQTTEAHPAAILIHLLSGFGNLVGRGPHVMVGDKRHSACIMAACVGPTAMGRKGTSASMPVRVLSAVDDKWGDWCIQSSLATGEGLIALVRDNDAV